MSAAAPARLLPPLAEATPLITVVTPTWQRHDLLLERLIPAVRRQSYARIEHIVVSDGPDPALTDKLLTEAVGVRFFALPEHTGRPHAAIRFGHEMAHGALVTDMADDDLPHPDYLRDLHAAIAERDVDFAFPMVECYPAMTALHTTIGTDGIVEGQITAVLYRRELLDLVGDYQLEDGWLADYALYKRWEAAGARWAFVPRVLYDHRDDHADLNSGVVKGLRLNIGCGPVRRSGEIGVDVNDVAGADVHADISVAPWPFPDECAVFVRLDHVLEHIEMRKAQTVLSEAFRVLEPGGAVRVGVPDMKATFEAYVADDDLAERWYHLRHVYGSQTHVGEYHKSGWDGDLLTDILRVTGFVDIVVSDDNDDAFREEGFCIKAEARKP